LFRVEITGKEIGKYFLDGDVSATCELLRRVRDSSQPWSRWREAHDLVNERALSGLCMWPFYCGQAMDRCACSGSSCL